MSAAKLQSLFHSYMLDDGLIVTPTTVLPKGKHVSRSDMLDRLMSFQYPNNIKLSILVEELSPDGVWHYHGLLVQENWTKTLRSKTLTFRNEVLRELDNWAFYCCKGTVQRAVYYSNHDGVRRRRSFDVNPFRSIENYLQCVHTQQ